LLIAAGDLENHGGNLVANQHFENWGKPGDTVMTKNFTVPRTGSYEIQAEFANGAGPVNTGITCAVKKLELRKMGSAEVLATGYLIMPQSGDWQRWDLSSPIVAQLSADARYRISICEDDAARNMSCLKNNERYTAWPGGGETNYNYVNIAALHLTRVADDSFHFH